MKPFQVSIKAKQTVGGFRAQISVLRKPYHNRIGGERSWLAFDMYTSSLQEFQFNLFFHQPFGTIKVLSYTCGTVFQDWNLKEK